MSLNLCGVELRLVKIKGTSFTLGLPASDRVVGHTVLTKVSLLGLGLFSNIEIAEVMQLEFHSRNVPVGPR